MQTAAALRQMRHLKSMTPRAGLAVGVAAVLTAAVSLAGARPAPAAVAPAPRMPIVGDGAAPAALPDPDAVLPHGWRTSTDRAVTVSGDTAGLHVLVADESDGYAWRTAATLGAPGVDTSRWIGQACVTGSGDAAVVVYAPREVTDEAGAQGSLARAAVVDLDSGAVHQLGGGFSIAYFDPGCGTGEQAVLTKGGWSGDGPNAPATTRLDVVDARTAAVTESVTVAGQVTSAVPYDGAIAAAAGGVVERIDRDGRTRTLADTAATAFHLVPDAAGGLGYQTVAGRTVQLHRLDRGGSRVVASAAAGAVELQQTGGRVWVTGPQTGRLRGLPAQWRAAPVASQSQISTTGALAVTDTDSGTGTGSAAGTDSGTNTVTGTRAGRLPGAVPPSPDSPLPVQVRAQLLSGARPVESFAVPAAAEPAAGAGPSATKTPAISGDPTSPVSPDRTCAIAVNDAAVQAYQPSFQQVEWAADQAVQGRLTDNRGPNLYGTGLPAFTPQGMFPQPGLTGGGGVPAQVLLGVLTQESNLEQASRHVVQGQMSNPLASDNWYGNWGNDDASDSGQVQWKDSDCGYGIAQVTTGMCAANGQNGDPQCQGVTPLPHNEQLALAVDYQANIAAGLQVLEQKWNQLAKLGITPNGAHGGSQYIENWYLALWAYNAGIQPSSALYGNTTGCTPGPSCTDGNGDWGLGFANNPANPAYPPDRPQFPQVSSAQDPSGHAYTPGWALSHPQYWAYQEKVIGWAFNGVSLYDYSVGKAVQAFSYGSWPKDPTGLADEPSTGLFCTSADHCDPGVLDPGSAKGPDACQLTGSIEYHCWWHWPVSWTDCGDCGTQRLTYAAGAADPGRPAIAAYFQQQCTLPADMAKAVIVGASDPAPLGCPGENWTSAGPIDWYFGQAADGTTPSKILLDQVGAGFGGHFWFGYTITSDRTGYTSTSPANPADEVIGTWQAPATSTGWTRVMAHIPSYGAWTEEADYEINPGGGQPVESRILNQAQQANTWVDLGLFDLQKGASVSLGNATFDGQSRDIAWNAMAFVPASAPGPDYVAMGDSYSSGEGVQPFDPDSDFDYEGMQDACHRSGSLGSHQAYSQQVVLPGSTTPVWQQAAVPGGGVQYHFVACSGAYTASVTENALDTGVGGQVTQTSPTVNTAWAKGGYPMLWDELPQADDGWLNPQTTLVTLSAGGDDARFTDVLKGCVMTAGDCTDSDFYLKASYINYGTEVLDPQPLIQYEPTVINALGPHLKEVYQTIHTLAPNAEIVVVGYPRLFADSIANKNSCGVSPILGVPNDEAMWLNSMGNLLNSVTADQVSTLRQAGLDIHFIDPNNPGDGTSGFDGHNVCDSTGAVNSNTWINGVVVSQTSGSGTTTPGAGSFHPTAAGQAEFAKLVNECLRREDAC